MEALPTVYDGITYRSRLEARWAVVFAKLQIPVGYEPSGYRLGERCYLPDFVYDGLHIEIKPRIPTEEQAELYLQFAEEVGPLLVLCGQPKNGEFTAQLYFGYGVYCDFYYGMFLWHGDEWEHSLPIGPDIELFGGGARMVQFDEAHFGHGRKCGLGLGVYSAADGGMLSENFVCCPCNRDKCYYAVDSDEVVAAMQAARAERFGT